MMCTWSMRLSENAAGNAFSEKQLQVVHLVHRDSPFGRRSLTTKRKAWRIVEGTVCCNEDVSPAVWGFFKLMVFHTPFPG